MATCFKRIQLYCQMNKIPVFTKDQRADIGKLVFETFLVQKPPKEKINKVECDTADGKISVISYPKYFHPTIDKVIHEYRTTLADKAWEKIKAKMDTEEIILPESTRKRTRRPIPAYTTKK